MLACSLNFRNRVLSDNAAIVFHFNVQLVIRHNTSANFEDLCESVGTKPVFRIMSHMCLQQDLFLFATLATTIDKRSYDVTYLGYMSVSRDLMAIRQDESWKSLRMPLKTEFKLVQCHGNLYSPLGI